MADGTPARAEARSVARFRSKLAGRYDEAGWRDEAACRDLDPGMFFPVGVAGRPAEMAAVAKSICAACPVQLSCLKFSLATNQQFGIWGGYDEDERRVLRRNWRKGLWTPDSGQLEQVEPAAS